MKKIKKEHEVYAAVETSLYILVKEKENSYKVPKLLIIFDVASLEIINYLLYYEAGNIYNILDFFRETILKVSALSKYFIKPKEILLSSEAVINREIVKNIYDSTGIKILEYKSEEKKIDQFIDFLKGDIYKYYISKEKNVDEEEIKKFINSYIYLDSGKYSTKPYTDSLEEGKIFRELDCFLMSSKRKVSLSSVRFKNRVYRDDVLKELNGEEIEIRYSPSCPNRIYLFKEGNFYKKID